MLSHGYEYESEHGIELKNEQIIKLRSINWRVWQVVENLSL